MAAVASCELATAELSELIWCFSCNKKTRKENAPGRVRTRRERKPGTGGDHGHRKSRDGHGISFAQAPEVRWRPKPHVQKAQGTKPSSARKNSKAIAAAESTAAKIVNSSAITGNADCANGHR